MALHLKINTTASTVNVPVANMSEASIKWQTHRNCHDLGMRDMLRGNGNVFDGSTRVGRISYNGRAWDINDNPIELS